DCRVPNVSDVVLAVTPVPDGLEGGVVVGGGVVVAGGVAPPPATPIASALPALDGTETVAVFEPDAEGMYVTEIMHVPPAATVVQADFTMKRALLDATDPTVTVDDVLLVS